MVPPPTDAGRQGGVVGGAVGALAGGAAADPAERVEGVEPAADRVGDAAVVGDGPDRVRPLQAAVGLAVVVHRNVVRVVDQGGVHLDQRVGPEVNDVRVVRIHGQGERVVAAGEAVRRGNFVVECV